MTLASSHRLTGSDLVVASSTTAISHAGQQEATATPGPPDIRETDSFPVIISAPQGPKPQGLFGAPVDERKGFDAILPSAPSPAWQLRFLVLCGV